MTATDGRTATERLAETVEKWIADHHADNDRIDSLAVKGLCASLAAQGVGHRDDILRAFAEWYRKHWSEFNWEDGPPLAANRYLASLKKEEEG